MTCWPDAFVAIDVETTGTDPAKDRIVETATVVVLGRAVSSSWSTLLYPCGPIPAEATAVHGIDDSMVERAPGFADVAVSPLGEIASRLPAVAYSASFDRAFVAAEWARAGLAPAEWIDREWIDPLVWVRECQKYEKGKKLGDVARRLGCEMPVGLHRAAADARLLVDVTLALRTGAPWADWRRRNGVAPAEFFPGDYAACVERQTKLRAEQEASFAEWRRNNAPKEAANV